MARGEGSVLGLKLRIVRALDALLAAHLAIDVATALGGEIWLEDPLEP